MKKLKFIIAISLLITSIIVISCTKDSSNKTTKLNVNDFMKIGKIHNDFLTNVKDNFTIINDIKTENDKINAINQFNRDFVNSIELSFNEKMVLISELERTKELVKKSILISKAFGNNHQKSSDDSDQNLFDMIESLYNNGTIGNESYQILHSLANDLKDNYEGTLSDSQLKTNVISLINEFNDIGFSEGSEGEMVGTVLAISISSIEWWEQNPDASGNNRIAPWLAADLVGGAISGVVAASGQAVINGDVDWATVGWSALGGAVSASTGAVGRILRWFN